MTRRWFWRKGPRRSTGKRRDARILEILDGGGEVSEARVRIGLAPSEGFLVAPCGLGEVALVQLLQLTALLVVGLADDDPGKAEMPRRYTVRERKGGRTSLLARPHSGGEARPFGLRAPRRSHPQGPAEDRI